MNSINCILMVHDDDPLSSVIDQFLVLLFGRAQDDDPVSTIPFTMNETPSETPKKKTKRLMNLSPKSGSLSECFSWDMLKYKYTYVPDYGYSHLMGK